jgi:hypothetical protein
MVAFESELTEETLRDAGWVPGRRVEIDVNRWEEQLATSGFAMFPAARRALLEFGGLRVAQDAPGVECARSDFQVDPTDGIGEAEYFRELEAGAGTRLFPIGEAFAGASLLAIGEDGRVFSIMGNVELVGGTIYKALEALICGYLPVPLHASEQD